MAESGTLKSRIEKAKREIDEEIQEWGQHNISLSNVQHSNQSLFDFKCKVQALINVVNKELNVSEDKLELEFLTVYLNELRLIRETFEPEVRRRRMEKLMGLDTLPRPGIIDPKTGKRIL